MRPGESWQLEELMVKNGASRERLLDELGAAMLRHHPRLTSAPSSGRRFELPPTGWCSWYCFGPRVTAQQVLDNLDTIAKNIPGLTYVQIDDGYQSAMGDWLETGAAFGGNVRTVLDADPTRGIRAGDLGRAVRRRREIGAVPAAPGLVRQRRRRRAAAIGSRHVRRLASRSVVRRSTARIRKCRSISNTCSGRCASEWGCTYFKLDANFWGAMHGGRFHDPRATRVEAYRRGMQAILRGAGDSFLLGCNHPIWPSLGLIHGSRSSNDIKRTWDRIKTTARQNLQSQLAERASVVERSGRDGAGRATLTDAECQFHATAIYASGGMVLSGDDLTNLPPAVPRCCSKLLPPTGVAAEFDDATLPVGRVTLPDAGCSACSTGTTRRRR